MKKQIKLGLFASALLVSSLGASDDFASATVYSATKSEQSIKDVTSNVDVITGAELEERHVATVSEAINSLSGVNIASNGGLGQRDSLFIRGIDSKRILVLIDGIRYNEPTGLSGAPLAQLMVDDIERIEVVKGAQSGIWGADASGGVVNIITKSAKKGTHGSILLEIGSFNTKKYNATVSNKNEKYFVKINANKITTDGFSAFEAKQSSANYGKRGDELGLENDGYENTTYSIQGGINITDNDKIDMIYKNIDATYDYDSSTADDTTKQSDINHNFKTVNYYNKTDKFDTKVTISQSKFDRKQDTFEAKSNVDELAVQTKLNYSTDDMVMVGINKQDFEDTKNEIQYSTKALFVTNINKFDNVILSETLRYDDNDKYDEKVTGKIGIKYNLSKDIFISSNYGTAYNAPTLGNLNYTPTLKPETTKSFDVSFVYKDLKVTYFENKIEDMIQYAGSLQYENLSGETKLSGFELDYKKDITEDTLFTLNYTTLDTKDSDGKELKRRAKENLKFGVDYYGIDKFHFGFNGEYVGQRYDKADNQGAQTGNYTVANFVVNFEKSRNLKFYGKVNNLTDKYYQTVDGYATSPRAFYAGMKYNF